MNNTHKLLAAAALAGLVSGAHVNAASVAGQAADGSTVTLADKASCSGKDGCKGKKDGDKGSCSGKKEGEKASCAGKDGCPAKKEGDKKAE